MVVVYPENVWYWGVTPDDADEIVREHLIGGRPQDPATRRALEKLRRRFRPV